LDIGRVTDRQTDRRYHLSRAGVSSLMPLVDIEVNGHYRS